jgi:triphosphatase
MPVAARPVPACPPGPWPQRRAASAGARARLRAAAPEGQAVETELKFQVPPAQRAALLKAVATASAQRTRLQAVYADTPDQRLAAAGLALRLRKEGRQWVQTLKGRGDGLMQRLEHELPLPAQRGVPQLDPARHAGTTAGAALQAALAGGGELQPVYRTDIQRLHRQVRHGGAVIEIAYDRGRILAAGRSLAVDEIEFELVRGPAAALPDLAARWAQRFGLWWDVRTKSERGFRLALSREQVPPVKAEPLHLPGQAGIAAAWALMLQASLVQALPNMAEIASGSDTPEHLHQLRVALRRLRTVLRVYGPWCGDAARALALEADWRQPFSRLGQARDLDVMVARLQPLLQAASAPAFSWPVPADGPGPAQIVRDPAFTRLLLRTLALALPDAAAASPAQPWPAAARELIKPLLRQARRGLRVFGQAGAEQQHRVRRRLKRLRYALEPVRSAF